MRHRCISQLAAGAVHPPPSSLCCASCRPSTPKQLIEQTTECNRLPKRWSSKTRVLHSKRLDGRQHGARDRTCRKPGVAHQSCGIKLSRR